MDPITSGFLNKVTQAAVLIFEGHIALDQLSERFQVMVRLEKSKPLPGFEDPHSLSSSPLIGLFDPEASVLVGDAQTDTRLTAQARSVCARNGVQSLILLPIRALGRCFGLAVGYFGVRCEWTESDHRYAKTLIDQVGVALDKLRLADGEKHARSVAEEENRVLLGLLEMISHDLRTPLTSIKGFATTLLADDVEWDAASRREFISIINEEADKLDRLIEQILDLARLTAGTLSINPQPLPLSDLIGFARPQLEHLAAQHQLIIAGPDGLPSVIVDPVRAVQVLTDLVKNAASYSPSDSEIAITFEQTPKMVQINVSDRGMGIDHKTREQMFAAFVQRDHRTADRISAGSGLGLAVCRGLVEAQGGTLWITDHEGGGNVFSFTIPIAFSVESE